jgi:glycosyltransferase involved in cell wall biosynthesis
VSEAAQGDPPLHLGFYYHSEVHFDPAKGPLIPSAWGLYITELARHAGRLTFYAHEAGPSDVRDFVLDDPRIETVNLGPRRKAPALTFLPRRSLRNFDPAERGVDVMLIRGPSAFLPALAKASAPIPVALEIVGDVANETAQSFFPWWRNELIRLWRMLYMAQQDRAARRSLVLAKSAALGLRGGEPFPTSEIVFTSTLGERDLRDVPRANPRWTADRGGSQPVRLLYTGRIVKDKGLFEAVRAVDLLAKAGSNVELHIVGWSHPRDPTASQLAELAGELGIGDRLVFRGYRPAGRQLLREYVDAEIYLFPTYGEGGVSYSMIEAMAVGLPMITTRIPAFEGDLHHRDNAYLIDVRSDRAIADAVEDLIADEPLRVEIAARGHLWAKDLTIEKSCELTVSVLRRWLDEPSSVGRG